MVPDGLTRRDLLRTSSVAVVGLAGCSVSGFNMTPTASEPDRIVEEWSRNDVPPYPIKRLEQVREAASWNAEYLGENMPTEPSLAFSTRQIDGGHVNESAAGELGGINSYLAESLRSEDDLYRVLSLDADLQSDTRDWIESVDFDESLLVLVGDCCGSSSVEHRWGRVEETSDGIHLHGYLTRPSAATMDLSPRFSLVTIDQPPADVDSTSVSFTVEESARVHFDAADDGIALVPSVFANNGEEAIEATLQIRTADGEVRVDDTFTVEAETEWKGIGLIGTVNTEFAVELTVDDLGIDVTDTYYTESQALGIRLDESGAVSIGRSDEI